MSDLKKLFTKCKTVLLCVADLILCPRLIQHRDWKSFIYRPTSGKLIWLTYFYTISCGLDIEKLPRFVGKTLISNFEYRMHG